MASAASDWSLSLPRKSVGLRIFFTQRLLFLLVALHLWSQVLQAPLRYALASVGFEELIYFPKLLLLVALVALPLLWPRVPVPALVITALAGLYLLWGMVNLPSFEQATFGMWVLVPLLFGLWSGSIVQIEQWKRLFAMLFVVAALGVFLNPLLTYPWVGFTIEFGGQTIRVSHQWWAFGLERYAGFARASFNAASQLLLFGVMLVVLLQRRSLKVLVWIIAAAGIVLTTSKGPLGAWLLLTFYFAGGALLRWPRSWNKFWFFILTLVLLTMITLPLSTLWMPFELTLDSYVSAFLLSSFGERLIWMWPDSLGLLDLKGDWQWWTGRGLGGIGAAQMYFEPENYLAADNLFVYIAVTLGIPVTLLLFFALWRRINHLSLSRNALAWRLPVFLALMAYGLVINQIEEEFLALFLGLALSRHDVKVDRR